jgi:hypothetical protein
MKNAIAKVVLASILPTVALTVIHAAVPSTATQNVPGKMNYQGYLRDPSTGNAYADGIYTLDCRIYSNDMGGTPLWGGRYSAYVKDGYFNIMLGDENATQNLDDMSGITYTGAANLWKALWGANSTDCKRFLGVTPLQDANHAVISSPTEIMPRQELLTAPFAFRAQSAQYASEAKENFTVGGNLTVTGTTTFSGAINAQSGIQSVGPIRASSTTVNFGNGYTSATSSNRGSLPSSIYNVGQYLYFYSYYAMNFKPTAGNINFTVPSGYDMKVTGSGDFISDVPVNTIGGTGTTTIKGGNVNITGTTTVNGYFTVNGSSILLKDTAGDKLELYNGSIYGNGNLSWQKASNGLTARPFEIKDVDVTISSSQKTTTVVIDSTDDYYWTVAGYNATVLSGRTILEMRAFKNAAGGWTLRVTLDSAPSASSKFEVLVLGVNKKMASYTYNP